MKRPFDDQIAPATRIDLGGTRLSLPHIVRCHVTGAHFQPAVVRIIQGRYAQIECEICDTNGRRRGQDGYDRTQPMIQAVELEPATPAGFIDTYQPVRTA